MAIDLSGIKSFVEDEMQDTIQIKSPVESEGGVYDPEIGDYVNPSTQTVLYSGPAIIGTYGNEAVNYSYEAFQAAENTYTLRLPIDSITEFIPPGSVIEVIDCVRSPFLNGVTMRVQTSFGGTFAVTYKMYAELIQVEVV